MSSTNSTRSAGSRRSTWGLAKLRKYGGRCVLGIQTISQLRQTYGRETAQTICANAGSKLLLRPGDHETAAYFSGELGDQIVKRTNISESKSTGIGKGSGSSESKSESTTQASQAAVMASELLALEDMQGYLSLAGKPPGPVRLEYMDLKTGAPAFEPKSAKPRQAPKPRIGEMNAQLDELRARRAARSGSDKNVRSS